MSADNCTNCGSGLQPEWVLCPRCGLATRCPSCKSDVESTWSWCPTCGNALSQPSITRSSREEDRGESPDEQQQQERLLEEVERDYRPFIERFSRRIPVPFWVLWIVVGELVFLVHYLLGRSVGVDVLGDMSWLLGAMIGLAAVLVDSGGRNLRRGTVRLRAIVDVDRATFADFCKRNIEFSLRDRNIIACGLALGVFNTLMCYVYGLRYEQPLLIASLHAQHFLIGFVGGLALWGAVGVIRTFRQASALEPRIDFDADDGCCGTAFLGRKVLLDASYFFAVGILAALYIVLSEWTHVEGNPWVKALVYSWAVVPYLVAIAVFILPVIEIHRNVERERSRHLAALRVTRRRLRGEIAQLEPERDAAQRRRRAALLEQYDRAREEGARLLALNTWPYNVKQVAQFVTTLIIPATVWILKKLQDPDGG